jgi:hypothetical protein
MTQREKMGDGDQGGVRSQRGREAQDQDDSNWSETEEAAHEAAKAPGAPRPIPTPGTNRHQQGTLQ